VIAVSDILVVRGYSRQVAAAVWRSALCPDPSGFYRMPVTVRDVDCRVSVYSGCLPECRSKEAGVRSACTDREEVRSPTFPFGLFSTYRLSWMYTHFRGGRQ
jgi:hypothetical protein